jgi:hypothetical protein
MKRFRILLLMPLLFGCQINKVDNVKELLTYYEDGSLKSKGYEADGKPIGPYFEFYPDSTLKVEAHYLNGLQDSIQKVYYENGALYQKMFFTQGLLQGKVEVYDKIGNLLEIQEYVIVSDSSVLNQFYTYEGTKLDTSKSYFFTLSCPMDSLDFGETYELTVKLEKSQYYMNMLVIIGEYDETFQQLVHNKNDSLWDRNDGKYDMSVMYQTKDYNLGMNTIRGVIWDYVTYYDGDTSKVARDVRRLYFKKDFYIK